MKHKHWIFYAYDELTSDQGYVHAVETTVNDAQNETEALEEVKKIIARKFYTLRKVFECTDCFYKDEQQRTLRKLIEKEI